MRLTQTHLRKIIKEELAGRKPGQRSNLLADAADHLATAQMAFSSMDRWAFGLDDPTNEQAFDEYDRAADDFHREIRKLEYIAYQLRLK